MAEQVFPFSEEFIEYVPPISKLKGQTYLRRIFSNCFGITANKTRHASPILCRRVNHNGHWCQKEIDMKAGQPHVTHVLWKLRTNRESENYLHSTAVSLPVSISTIF